MKVTRLQPTLSTKPTLPARTTPFKSTFADIAMMETVKFNRQEDD